MKTKSLFVFTSIISLASFAQTGNLKGSIKTSDGKPAEYVSVGLIGTNKGTSANSKGEYELKNMEPGTYSLKTSFVGLETIEQQIVIKENETTVVPEIILKETSQTLKEVVVSASRNKYSKTTPSSTLRLNMPLIEIPQNIQIVTNDVLKDQQVISMSDGVSKNVSGLNKLEHWGDLYTYISGRGSRVEAFRNGFKMVNSSWGPLTEDMSFVDHIEFVKGPAGFMLSNGNPSGLYNVVTKKPTGVNKGETSFTLGSYDLYRSTLDVEGKLSENGKLLYRLNVSAQNKKTHRKNEYNDRYAIAPVISYQVDEKTKLTMEYTYQRANSSNLGSYYVFTRNDYATLPVGFSSLPSGMPGTKMNDHSFYANLQHDFNKNWKITTQLCKSLYNQVGESMWAGSLDSTGKYKRGVSSWDAASNLTMAQVFVNGEVKTGSIRHKIVSGLDMANKNYLADWGQSHDLDTTGAEFDPKNPTLGAPSNGYPNFDRTTPLEQRAQKAGGLMSQYYSSLYLQDELGFLENKIRLTLAGRYTYLVVGNWGGKPDSAQHFTPRIGLSASIAKNFSAYALYDEAFTPQSGRLTKGGKVQPITGTNMEIGFKKDWFNGKWNTTLAVYSIVKNNELTSDPNNPPASGLSIVLGQKQAQGIEFDLQGTIAKGLNIIANYAYTDSRVSKVTEGVTIVKKGDNIPGYSKQTVNAWLSYKLSSGILNGWGVSAGTAVMMDRTSWGDLYWSKQDAKKLKNYSKIDAGLFWEKEKIKITANVFNVLNEYLYSGSYYSYSNAYYYQTEAPRNLRLSLNYKF
jgi:iron complex outermembrane recepter protein